MKIVDILQQSKHFSSHHEVVAKKIKERGNYLKGKNWFLSYEQRSGKVVVEILDSVGGIELEDMVMIVSFLRQHDRITAVCNENSEPLIEKFVNRYDYQETNRESGYITLERGC